MKDSFVIKFYTMKKIINWLLVIVVYLMIPKSGDAQVLNIYQGSEAELLQMNRDSHKKITLDGAVIILSDNLDALNVKMNIPYHPINFSQEVNTISFPGLLFDLHININLNKIERDATSAAMLATNGLLR